VNIQKRLINLYISNLVKKLYISFERKEKYYIFQITNDTEYI